MKHNNNIRFLSSSAALAGALSLAFATSACREEEYATVTEDTVLGTEGGDRVTLEGDVEKVYAVGFRLDPENGIINSSGVLVLPPKGMALPREGSEVAVKGVVREIPVVEFEREFGLIWSDYEADFEEKTIVVARAMVITELTDDAESAQGPRAASETSR